MLGVDGVRVDDDSDTGDDVVGLGQHCSTLGRGWRYKEDVLQCNVKMWHLICTVERLPQQRVWYSR